MEGVNPYLELLKEEVLKKCSEIDSSICMLRKLQLQDFKRIAEIIQTALSKYDGLPAGHRNANDTAVSVSTLKRLFQYGYSLSKDQRTTNTLDKLCFFLEYDGWDDFIQRKNGQFQQGSIEALLVDIVTKANESEYQSYRALPRIDTTELLKYYTTSGSGFLRIQNVLIQHKKKNWTIGNEGNPSGHTPQKIWIEKMDSEKVIIMTQEYWYLRWYDLSTNLYCHIYNEQNQQTYTLELVEGSWKISSVYYPSPKNSVQIKHVVFAYLPRPLQTFIKKLLSDFTQNSD